MKWSEKTWEATAPIFCSITQMPFIRELADGTLPREKFLFYIAQDDIYLQGYARALALIAARATTPGEVAAFVKFSQIALVSEQMMHDEFFKDGPATGPSAEIQPACHHYVSYLLSVAANEPVEVAMAAVLPCFWIYREVGAHIHKTAKANAGAGAESGANPYQAWIDTYVGDEFDALVDEAIALCDAAAERSTPELRARMMAAYTFATRLEFDFWAAGYNLRTW
ncbi:MAG: TenA family protein [Alistipes sp.]|jgi:thiaminase/transcriptional activator TenA|nr:TenA family protein [Alistipes sp.]